MAASPTVCRVGTRPFMSPAVVFCSIGLKAHRYGCGDINALIGAAFGAAHVPGGTDVQGPPKTIFLRNIEDCLMALSSEAVNRRTNLSKLHPWARRLTTPARLHVVLESRCELHPQF